MDGKLKGDLLGNVGSIREKFGSAVSSSCCFLTPEPSSHSGGFHGRLEGEKEEGSHLQLHSHESPGATSFLLFSVIRIPTTSRDS